MRRQDRDRSELRDTVLAALKRASRAKHRDALARYGIVAPSAYGVPMRTIQELAKRYGQDHALAEALWNSGVYEARLMAAFVDDPARVTAAQMNRWCAGFENWAECDTLTFYLFDRAPGAFARVEAWHGRRAELVRRGAFALLAAIALHDKAITNTELLRSLPWCEAAATDDRNFVTKGVSWALRAIGVRNTVLHGATIALATRLAASSSAPSQWIGKDVLRDLQRPLVARKLAKLVSARETRRRRPRSSR